MESTVEESHGIFKNSRHMMRVVLDSSEKLLYKGTRKLNPQAMPKIPVHKKALKIRPNRYNCRITPTKMKPWNRFQPLATAWTFGKR